MTPDSHAFLLAEYAALRGEVLSALEDVAGNEKLALLASVGYWAVLGVTSPGIAGAGCQPWLPLGLTGLLFFRWRGLENKFTTCGAYLARLESAFELDGLGWEHHIQAQARRWFRFHGWLFWVLLALGNLGASLWWPGRVA